MTSHNQFGKSTEILAAVFFREKGFDILFSNWRHSHYEIDLIAIKNNKLHFIEVKGRRSNRFGHPEENVTPKKFKYLLNAADEFLHQHPQYKHVQYDILAITILKNQEPEYFLIEDVYL
jgi:putative endonuclease